MCPLNIYHGPSQVYSIKPEGIIHQCIKGGYNRASKEHPQ